MPKDISLSLMPKQAADKSIYVALAAKSAGVPESRVALAQVVRRSVDARRGQVKVAESNRDVVLSQIRQEEINFNQDIFLLVENFNNQAAQLEIAQEADVIAEKRYRTSIETFMIGKIDILDLNDARQSKDDAKQKHIQELYNYWNYYYNIRSLTLYDFINNRTLDADFEEIVRR